MPDALPDALPDSPPESGAAAEPSPDEQSVRLTSGDTAPDWTLPQAGGGSRSLSDYLGRTLIVYFYPAAGTPGCTVESCDFQEAQGDLGELNVDIVGISPDPVPRLETFAADQGLTFPLLSDVDRKVLTSYGVWGTKTTYGRPTTGVIRSTFVVGPDGRIRHALYNVRAKGHVAKIREIVGS